MLFRSVVAVALAATEANLVLALIKDLFGPNTKLASVAAKATATTTVAKDTIKTPAMPIKTAEVVKPAEPVAKTNVKSVATEAAVEGGAAKVSSNNSDGNNPIVDAVNAWAKAWSAKNVNNYLASYSDSFKTPKGESRKEWEQTRRERVGRPAKINVEVSNPKVVMDGSNIAKVSFKQTYSANGKPQHTSKTLTMKKVGDSWLIDQESTGN